MDIKIVPSQPLTNMNSQNINLQRGKENQTEQIKNQEFNQDKKKASLEDLKQAIDNLNKKLEILNSQLRIEIDKDTGIKVVKVIDKQTNEVIRQIPPDAVLKIAKYLDEVTGLLFNEKV